jgi:hypothetical protein
MSEVFRYARSLAEAFKDERAYAMWGPNGKPIFFLKRRSLWERIWSIFK